ncbi:hypothetical protein TRFO_22946 [Tritrichomonas foetus]|uniref:Uncharacterized protein n=1 Tax=Tritrichomonas foetus TaxID=1144522 RepID=A0A1J4KAT1_9EUKA|nr:hypothetical protein TRFO_22946 [Tritrichomonas foetus]|eukprot:OHT08521.1 hypothetical protein TRFO_22946 [Tritrichomonas foetus]
MHKNLDEITQKVVNVQSALSAEFEKAEMNKYSAIDQKRRNFHITFQEQQKQNEEALKDYEAKIEDFINTKEERTKKEEERVKGHYDKQLMAKMESLVMTEAAAEKAQVEIEHLNKENEVFVNELKAKNDKDLNERLSKMKENVEQAENEANSLENQVHEVLKKQNELAPEMNKIFKERSDTLNDRFRKEDEEFELLKKNHQFTIDSLTQEHSKLTELYESLLKNKDKTFVDKNKEFDNKIRQIQYDRNEEIKAHEKEQKEKHKAKIKKLKENLINLKQTAEKDFQLILEKQNEKKATQKDRINRINEDHKAIIDQIQGETNNLKAQLISEKEDWQKQKEKVKVDYNKEKAVIEKKTETENRYYQFKSEALHTELQRVLRENAKIEEEIHEGHEELINGYKSAENIFLNELEKKKQIEINERVKKKMDEIREIHSMETQKLLEEIQKAKLGENNLLSELEKEKKARETAETLKELGIKSNSNNDSTLSLFTSSRFMAAAADKWKEETFVESKKLKIEESNALKQLDQSKLEFFQAVNRTNELKEKIISTAQYYQSAISKAQECNEEELQKLQEEIKEKEKEIMKLELQFDENESELRQKNRQLNQAEDRVSHLRAKMAAEKMRIKEIIKKEYTAQINETLKNNEQMMNILERFRNELEMQIEFVQHDIYLVENSNQAMAEGIAKETQEMVNFLKDELLEKLISQEDLEREQSEKIIHEIDENFKKEVQKFKVEEKELLKKYELEKEQAEKSHKARISVVNDICIELISQNNDKKEIVAALLARKCDNCHKFDESIKKIKTVLIKMQEDERKLELERENKEDTMRKFKPNMLKPLPPLAETL